MGIDRRHPDADLLPCPAWPSALLVVALLPVVRPNDLGFAVRHIWQCS
jgi:hypothetical protein